MGNTISDRYLFSLVIIYLRMEKNVNKLKNEGKYDMKKPSTKTTEHEQQIGELTQDLQRIRADFENYRKRVEQEKTAAQQTGETKAIMKLLPVIDTIERAVAAIPADIADHQWVQGVAGLVKQLETALRP